MVDISLRAVAGPPSPDHPAFTPDPLAGQLGDGVDSNDRPSCRPSPTRPRRGRGFEANTASPFPYVRCPSGRVYELTTDGSLGQYVPDPTTVGMAPILQASEAFPPSWINA